MPAHVLNEELLPENPCFGCGRHNPDGLRIAVTRDPVDPERIIGRFEPRETMVGFPGIHTRRRDLHRARLHGDVQRDDSARDAGALGAPLGDGDLPPTGARRQAHRPHGADRGERGEWEAIRVRGEARDPEGELLVDGSFKVIPLPPDRFKHLIGTDGLPADWDAWLQAQS